MRRYTSLILTLLAVSAYPAFAQTIEEKAEVCGACHGPEGIPQEKTTPIIWGQHVGYIYLQLRDYKRGTRKNEQMSAIVEQFEREDMLALAEYFGKKPWPFNPEKDAPAAVAQQALKANVAVGCTGCHLGEYQGDATVGRLAGQSSAYLEKTMLEFRDKARGNNPGMSSLMLATSESDIAALAQYLATLRFRE